MTDVVRFPAQLPYIDSYALITVGDLVNQGKIAEAVAHMQANQQACANALGAVVMWRNLFTPVTATLIPINEPSPGVTLDFPRAISVGDVFYFKATRAGGFSGSVLDGAQVWGSVSDSPGEFPPASTLVANGTIPGRIQTNIGQYCNIKLSPGMPTVMGRYDLS